MRYGYGLSDLQLALWQWGRWYRQLFELGPADRPDDAVINDDKRADKWFDQYLRTAARKAGRGHGDSRYTLDGDVKAIPVFTPEQEAEHARQRQAH